MVVGVGEDKMLSYRIYNARGEFVDETNSAFAAMIYQRTFFPKGKVERCYVTPLVIVARMTRVTLETVH